jgi:hypothetical protein
MIDPKHLRLGNYIRYNEKFPDDPELELDNEGPLSEDDFNYMLIDDGTFRQNAEYIPLTAEWLKRFGFKSASEGYWDDGALEVGYTTTDENMQYEYLSIKSLTEMVDLKYVHQLQNLYFALTGQELTLNPTTP